MKLDVPYYSQFVDVTDPFWMLRACGAVALKEVVEFHGVIVPDIVTLCNEGKDRGGYDMENGWVHDYLVLKAKELGLEAHRKEGLETLDGVIEYLEKGNPVIVSVEKRVLEQKRFHIIVLTGFDSTSKLFSYHESESTDKEKGKHRTCDMETFQNYWRGKAIFIEKTN
jgi:Peptidase_C39 like family